MEKKDWLTKSFEATRSHLKAVAYRMLGSTSEAEDAVQEAWIRLTQSDSENIENLNGWLTTVVARVCLDMLRSRKSRKEETLEKSEFRLSTPETDSPDANLLLADSIGPALLTVLGALAPAERIAFVLHDLFGVSFEEIAPVVGKSAMATRQLASRARRRIQGTGGTSAKDEVESQLVAAFLSASRDGNFTALLELLDPAIVLNADETAVQVSAANRAKGAPEFASEVRDARVIANLFKGKATAAQLALIDGTPGATWIAGGKPRVVFAFSIQNGKIAHIDVIMNPADLAEMDVKPVS